MKNYALLFKRTLVALACCSTLLLTTGLRANEQDQQEVEKRATTIAPTLADAPNYGARNVERALWDRLANTASGKKVLRQAEGLLKAQLPDLPESLYKEYYRNGNRTNYQTAYNRLIGRFKTLTLAEMFENKGRFVAPLAETLEYFCDQPSWVLPAHDYDGKIYDGQALYSDLVSTCSGGSLAIAINLLEDKLPKETVERVKSEIERRVLKPYRDAVAAEKPQRGMWWVRTHNNWNSVCHAGTIAAALNVVDSKEERAFYLAGADYFSETCFMKGFTKDGYCSEGMGYWNYGVGNYLALGALARVATNGSLDLFRFPKMRAILDYAPTLEIDKGNYAVFADCAMNAKPYAEYVGYLSRLKGYGYVEFETRGLGKNFDVSDLFETVAFAYDQEVVFAPEPAEATKFDLPIRTEFPDAGVVICRPNASAKGYYFATAFKGGHNAEMHNHNDVGSYTLVLGNAADPKAADLFVSRDPGGETYTARTFSSRRYEGELLNSYGHPVPRIAGTLQSTGAAAKGVYLAKDFSNERDSVTIDLRSAYNVPTLKTLTRSFEYERAADNETGAFTIVDAATFEEGKEEEFETAIITFEKPEIRDNGNALTIKIGNVVVNVDARDAKGAEQKIVAETAIVGEKDESVKNKPTRVALKVKGKVNSTVVTQRFEVAK